MELQIEKEVQMSDEMKVSIITVTYNAAETIEQTISCVLEQSYKNIEYIVVDGISTDGTWEKICKYKNQIHKVIHEKDKGLYDAMNKGIALATGDIVGIINGDDWYETDTVENVVKAFCDNVDVIYGNMRLIGDNGCADQICDYVDIRDIWYSMIPHPTVFVRKHIYNEYGIFDLDYLIASDYELILRFYIKGVRFQYINKVLANFRHGGLTTGKWFECAREVKKVSMTYIDKCPEKDKYKKNIIESYNNALMRAAYEQRDEIFKENLDKAFIYKNNTLCIFGSGIWGERCARKLKRCGVQRYYFIDNDIRKQGKQIDEHEVLSPDRLQEMECNIIIAVSERYDEISRQLAELGNHQMQWIGMFDLYKE
jgi:glycosyltransferase involved in cell wall biosynthesis